MGQDTITHIRVNESEINNQLDLLETDFKASKIKEQKEPEIFYDNPLQDNISKKLIGLNEVLLNENWGFPKLISGRVLKITKDAVSCECLINKEKQLTQLMSFPRILFDNILELRENSYVKVKISQKPGSIKTEIIDGKGLGIESDFYSNDIWDALEDFPNKEF